MTTFDWLLVAGIAVGNNLDNGGAAVAFGLARIRVPVPVNAWISGVTFLITAAAVSTGGLAVHLIPAWLGRCLSAVILCTIGLFMIAGALRQKKAGAEVSRNPILGVLQDPERADVDRSRHIDYREGALLGIALSINNVGGGISAGLVHLSVLWTAGLSAVVSFGLFLLGGVFARASITERIADRAPILGGLLLIVVGICQFR